MRRDRSGNYSACRGDHSGMFAFKTDFAVAAILVVAAAGSAGANQSAKKASSPKSTGGAGRGPVLVVVNGDPISEADLDRAFAFLNVPDEERPRVRQKFVENLVDTRLIQQFLKSRKTVATKQEIEQQITLL